MSLHIDQIRTDGGTQSRAAINQATVAEYAEAMSDPDTVFPPVIVYHDGTDYWLADGFHRLAAWRSLERTEIPADVRQGDRRRAILHSLAANANHGLRRTNEDKRRAVLTLLEDEEWARWSNREIAKRCAVSHEFVNGLRSSLATVASEAAGEPRTYTTRHGTTATMNTAAIGQKPTAEAPATAPAVALPVAPEPQAPEAPEDKERKALAKLTPAALIDDILGLRADLTDAKKTIATQKAEIADLKARLADATDSDSGQVIRRLQASVKQAENEKWRQTEETAAAKRQVHALKKRIAELESMGIPLN
jgi:ParB-like chromosome segregation protein Spo0J